MFARFFYLSVCVFFAVGSNELESRDVNRCERFSLPKQKDQFTKHLETFLARNGRAATSICSLEDEAVADDIGEIKSMVKEMMSHTKKALAEMKNTTEEWRREREEMNSKPKDCFDILVNETPEELKKSGVYRIYPYRCPIDLPVKVFCDMETDGGGWTVFLARMNQTEQLNFTRPWTDYKRGFGHPEGEYWLGNENLHRLTSARNYQVRLEAQDYSGEEIWGEWNTFEVDSKTNKYQLRVGDYNEESLSPDIQFSYHNGINFSTFDQDNDNSTKGSCAKDFRGGWWYNECFRIHPTGLHGAQYGTGIEFQFSWSKSGGGNHHFAHLMYMKIRPFRRS